MLPGRPLGPEQEALNLSARSVKAAGKDSCINAVVYELSAEPILLSCGLYPLLNLGQICLALHVKGALLHTRPYRALEPKFLRGELFVLATEHPVQNPGAVKNPHIQPMLATQLALDFSAAAVRDGLTRDEECLIIASIRTGDLADIRLDLRPPVPLGAERERPALPGSIGATCAPPDKSKLIRERIGLRVHLAVPPARWAGLRKQVRAYLPLSKPPREAMEVSLLASAC